MSTEVELPIGTFIYAVACAEFRLCSQRRSDQTSARNIRHSRRAPLPRVSGYRVARRVHKRSPRG